MIDKVSGKVAYAVISFGGFLGMGEDYYPLPWANLKYDTNLGRYRVGITESQLKEHQSSIETRTGTGPTAAETRVFTTIITLRFGIRRVRKAGRIQRRPFSSKDSNSGVAGYV